MDVSTREADPLLGRVIADRYEVVSLINAGGMGVVYRAQQRSLDRPVAIKFIHPQFLTSDLSVQRFMDEARAVSRMNHPHVVSVFDFGRTPEADGGYLFLVMELLTGPDLAKVLAHEPILSIPRVVSIVTQTLDALAEAHHLGIVHRDVKPENIVLEPTRSGQEHVKVIDFGIAKIGPVAPGTSGGYVSGTRAVEGQDSRRSSGTPSYMAPEQIQGVAGPSVDIYSAGVMLYEMLVGHLPPSPAELASDPSAAQRLDPRKAAPRRGIPEVLATACVGALHLDPARRYPDAQTFANAIRSATSSISSDRYEVFERPAAAPAAKRALSATLPAISAREGDGMLSIPSTSGTEGRKASPLPLVGREDELVWACGLLASDNPPPAIALWGRSGIGRTRLAREVAAIAERDGALVVSVGLPPRPSNEVGYIGLRHVVRALSGLTPAELMDERAIGAVDRWALTGLRVLFSKAKPPAEPNNSQRTAEAALAWGMKRAVSRSEARRVVLVIDDLDRLDGASFLALREHLEVSPVPGVTVLVTSAHMPTVLQLSGVRERGLRGLSRGGARAMLAALGVQAELPRTDDDIEPLYVFQVAAMDPADARSLPESLHELVGLRMQGLSVGQRRILQALALVGVQHVESLRSMLVHPGDLDSALEWLIQGAWIERSGAHVLLRHALYGEVALSGAAPSTIAAIHKAAAHQLRDARPLAELRAYHAIQGAADFEAFVMQEDVARARSARGDTDGAITALTRARDAARVQVQLGETEAASAALGVFGKRLGAALCAARRFDEAKDVLDDVLRLATPRALTRVAALEQLATIARHCGRATEAVERLREGLAIAGATNDEKLVQRLEEAIERLEQGGSLPPAPTTSPPPSGIRVVLIVEDDPAIREGLQAVLEAEGYTAFGAANGREALALIPKRPRPGLIMLDLMMPEMDGWELLEVLSADPDLASIPTVVVSAVSDLNPLTASRVLRKPVEVGKLLSVVEEFCA